MEGGNPKLFSPFSSDVRRKRSKDMVILHLKNAFIQNMLRFHGDRLTDVAVIRAVR